MATIIQLFLSGIMLGGIYALMSMGLTLIFGVLRVVNFAHGEFLMLAMYGAWGLNALFNFTPYVSIIIIVPVLFGFGLLIYILMIHPAIDKPHLVVVFATMGLSIMLQNVALLFFTADLRDVPPLFGGQSLSFGPIYLKIELILGFIISICTTMIVVLIINRTYFGKAIRATVQDQEAAMLMGINVPKIFALTFAAGSALVGLAGSIMIPLYSTFPTVGLNFVLIAFVIVVLGGMGSMVGALLGGFGIGLMQAFSGYYIAPAFGQMFYFLLFLLIMVLRPAGILGQKGAAMVGINE
jgi:branched-chain amino acid transport system permease protein